MKKLTLEQKLRIYQKRTFLAVLGLPSSVILTSVIGIYSLFLFFFCAAVIAFHSKQITIIKSGVQGENKTKEVLKTLPKGYFTISDINIDFEGKNSQLDHIVIGPSGIFIVETKNLKGEIRGDHQDKHLIQYKTGKRGGEYSKEFYNPIKQVGTHVYRLSNFLKEYGIHQYVQGVVFFSNEDCEVYVTSDKTPIFSILEKEEMIDYIKNYPSKDIPDEKVLKIFHLLETKKEKSAV